jgi:hypothetical protein
MIGKDEDRERFRTELLQRINVAYWLCGACGRMHRLIAMDEDTPAAQFITGLKCLSCGGTCRRLEPKEALRLLILLRRFGRVTEAS